MLYIISSNNAYNIDFIKKISIKEYESNVQIMFRIPGEYFFVDIHNTCGKNEKELLESCIQALDYIEENYSNFIDYDEFQNIINDFVNRKV